MVIKKKKTPNRYASPPDNSYFVKVKTKKSDKMGHLRNQSDFTKITLTPITLKLLQLATNGPIQKGLAGGGVREV